MLHVQCRGQLTVRPVVAAMGSAGLAAADASLFVTAATRGARAMWPFHRRPVDVVVAVAAVSVILGNDGGGKNVIN